MYKIIVPAEKLAAVVNKYLIPALRRKDPEEVRQLVEGIKKPHSPQ